MKYIIDVDKDRIDCSGQLFIAVDIPNSQSAYEIPTGMWVKEYTEPDRKAIEDEVWDFARRIICPSDCCEDSISKYTEEFLGIPSHKARAIFKDLSYQEAKAKYEAWKKQKDEIRVGDEVEYDGCGEKVRFIVTGIKDSTAYGFRQIYEYEDVSDVGEYCDIDMLIKTGRHFKRLSNC